MDFAVGDYVLWRGWQVGRVETVAAGCVWVVFECDDDWERYQEFTGELVRVSDLRKVDGRVEMKDKEFMEKFIALPMFQCTMGLNGHFVMRVPGGYIIERVEGETTDSGMFVPWSAVLSDPDVQTKK